MTYTVIDRKQAPGLRMFNDTDLDMLRSSSATKKINKIFAANRYNINIHVLVDCQSRREHSDPRKQVEFHQKRHLTDPNALNVIYTNNITTRENYIPMTAWILAHRMGHMTMIDHTWTTKPVWLAAKRHLTSLFGDNLQGHGALQSDSSFNWGIECPLFKLMPYIMTMRSARMGKLTLLPDFFAEMLAQHVITGKFTFLRAEKWEERYAVMKASGAINKMGDNHSFRRSDHQSEALLTGTAEERFVTALLRIPHNKINAQLAKAEAAIDKALSAFVLSGMGKTITF